ncbi:hypothetical protein DBV15_08917 [Temnothorax longispinosus]|uniref:Uncharacterized protein n=1 Tax=Temnothorax longispinosus TaxID=300112 RepID=A0A4S2KFU4_9HYME|nr:hypothetical protein DBV15_08917 [Temnothorax longispinosus]
MRSAYFILSLYSVIARAKNYDHPRWKRASPLFGIIR